MSFSDKQRRALKAKLNHRHVKTRSNQGATIAYVEGWHAIAEANRIFGYDSWDRQTQSPHCIWSDTQRGQSACFYSTKVRITVRAGGTITVREGIGTGFGRSPSAEVAHDIAVKAAETDATKRALATFGNPFGLALYDKDLAHVTRPRSDKSAAAHSNATVAISRTEPKPLVLALEKDHQTFEDPKAFAAAAIQAVASLKSIDAVYTFWEANLSSFASLRSRLNEADEDPVTAIISVLKGRARALGQLDGVDQSDAPINVSKVQVAAETSGLAFPKEKRIRSKEHLAFVANQPCLVCGRKPSHAHHLRFAQPRAMAMKVSDEFTVPLCNTHHDALHRSGDERAWWARNGIIEPLKFAARLWAASRLRSPSADDDEVQNDIGPSAPPQPEIPEASNPSRKAPV